MNKKQLQAESILNHGLKLARYYGNGSNGGPVSLCKALHRIEVKLHRLATDLCNGTIEQAEFCRASDRAEKRVLELLPNLPAEHLRINQDPRGYTLKIATEHAPQDLYRDWGGYGIIVPEF